MRIPCRLNKKEQHKLQQSGVIEVERSRRIAYGGDWIQLDGFCYVLTDVRICHSMSCKHKRPAFIHTFKSQQLLAKFHTHEMWDGICIHCGFVPEREPTNETQ